MTTDQPIMLRRLAAQRLAEFVHCEVASLNAFGGNESALIATDFPAGECSEPMRAILGTYLESHPLVSAVMRMNAGAHEFYQPIGLGARRHCWQRACAGEEGRSCCQSTGADSI